MFGIVGTAKLFLDDHGKRILIPRCPRTNFILKGSLRDPGTESFLNDVLIDPAED